MGKNCALGLEYGPRPSAWGRTQDLGHSFFPYGPPARQITYTSFLSSVYVLVSVAGVKNPFYQYNFCFVLKRGNLWPLPLLVN